MSILTAPIATMPSREIAELTGKEHKHIRRGIEKMLLDLGEDGSKFGRIDKDACRRDQNEYALPKNLTLALIADYRADLRLKIIDRWMELEAGGASQLPPKSLDRVTLLSLWLARSSPTTNVRAWI